MTTFQILWMIAGAIIGFWGPQSLLALKRVKTHIIADLAFAFVGALVAYTLTR